MVELHQLPTEILFIKRVRAKFALTLVLECMNALIKSKRGTARYAVFS